MPGSELSILSASQILIRHRRMNRKPTTGYAKIELMRGYTLLELIVIIAIIGILAAVVLIFR